jgi:hypothetical protein
MQEILVVAAIALAVIFIPRFMNRKSGSESESQPRRQPRPASPSASPVSKIVVPGWMRLVIVTTFLWVGGWAAYLRPWEGQTFLFFCISLGPAVALWGAIWAWFGYKKYRR